MGKRLVEKGGCWTKLNKELKCITNISGSLLKNATGYIDVALGNITNHLKSFLQYLIFLFQKHNFLIKEAMNE